MKRYINVAVIICCVSWVKAGQLLSTYNLISSPQLIYQQPQAYPASYGLISNNLLSTSYHQERLPAHPAALTTSAEESSVPSGLKKSDAFYGNPYIAGALAQESLNFNKEDIVYDRASEKIDRGEIFKLINNLKRAHHES